jgi:SAM-dependent methyltransferase
MFQDITPDRYASLHGGACQHDEFIDAATAYQEADLSAKILELLDLRGQSVLEIGPGTGHLLAAARDTGFSVAAVETNELHRKFIKDTWGLEDIYADLAEVPSGRQFDNVVAINVIEHVYDIYDFLASIRRTLSPASVLTISTSNAVSAEAAVLRTWWSMCKEIDHVSIPSFSGMRLAAMAAGLRAERVWSSELPFELPVSVMIAARDWMRERRPELAGRGAGLAAGPGAGDAARRARLGRLYTAGGRLDPLAPLLGTLGCAGSLKARLRPLTVAGLPGA